MDNIIGNSGAFTLKPGTLIGEFPNEVNFGKYKLIKRISESDGQCSCCKQPIKEGDFVWRFNNEGPL